MGNERQVVAVRFGGSDEQPSDTSTLAMTQTCANLFLLDSIFVQMCTIPHEISPTIDQNWPFNNCTSVLYGL